MLAAFILTPDDTGGSAAVKLRPGVHDFVDARVASCVEHAVDAAGRQILRLRDPVEAVPVVAWRRLPLGVLERLEGNVELDKAYHFVCRGLRQIVVQDRGAAVLFELRQRLMRDTGCLVHAHHSLLGKLVRSRRRYRQNGRMSRRTARIERPRTVAVDRVGLRLLGGSVRHDNLSCPRSWLIWASVTSDLLQHRQRDRVSFHRVLDGDALCRLKLAQEVEGISTVCSSLFQS